jgi:5-methylcytosine-specific restriction protein A
MSRIKMIQPRIKLAPTFAEARGIKTAKPLRTSKTLKERQAETGRTLALNGAAWRNLRAHVLSSEPCCRQCIREGRTTLATDVDHMNGADDNRMESLQPLCHACHSRKTQADMGKRVTWGCDINGLPLDPAHPWNNEPGTRAMALMRSDQKSPGADGCEPPCPSPIHGNRKDP